MRLNYTKLPNYTNLTFSTGGYSANLHAAETITIQPHDIAFVPTGIIVHMAWSMAGMISGSLEMLRDHKLQVFSNVISPEDKDEVIVAVRNLNSAQITIEAGQLIAKLRIIELGHLEE